MIADVCAPPSEEGVVVMAVDQIMPFGEHTAMHTPGRGSNGSPTSMVPESCRTPVHCALSS
jgi:hypothetical protein